MKKVIAGCGIVNFCEVTLVCADVISLEYITAVIECGSFKKHVPMNLFFCLSNLIKRKKHLLPFQKPGLLYKS